MWLGLRVFVCEREREIEKVCVCVCVCVRVFWVKIYTYMYMYMYRCIHLLIYIHTYTFARHSRFIQIASNSSILTYIHAYFGVHVASNAYIRHSAAGQKNFC